MKRKKAPTPAHGHRHGSPAVLEFLRTQALGVRKDRGRYLELSAKETVKLKKLAALRKEVRLM